MNSQPEWGDVKNIGLLAILGTYTLTSTFFCEHMLWEHVSHVPLLQHKFPIKEDVIKYRFLHFYHMFVRLKQKF